MKLRQCDDIILVLPDDPEPEVVEFTLDDAEALDEAAVPIKRNADGSYWDDTRRLWVYGPRPERSRGI